MIKIIGVEINHPSKNYVLHNHYTIVQYFVHSRLGGGGRAPLHFDLGEGAEAPPAPLVLTLLHYIIVIFDL